MRHDCKNFYEGHISSNCASLFEIRLMFLRHRSEQSVKRIMSGSRVSRPRIWKGSIFVIENFFVYPREVFLLEGLMTLLLTMTRLQRILQRHCSFGHDRSTQMLSTFGIQCPENITSAGQAFNLIRKTIDRIDLIDARLPKALRFQGRIADLVLDAPRLQNFYKELMTTNYA